MHEQHMDIASSHSKILLVHIKKKSVVWHITMYGFHQQYLSYVGGLCLNFFSHSLQNKIWNLPDRSTILLKFIYSKEGNLAGLTQVLPVRFSGPALILKTAHVKVMKFRCTINSNMKCRFVSDIKWQNSYQYVDRNYLICAELTIDSMFPL